MAEDVFKDHKTSLENNWVTYNCFPHIESTKSRLTVRTSEKHVFSKISAKKALQYFDKKKRKIKPPSFGIPWILQTKLR